MSDIVPKPDLEFLQLLQKLDTKIPGYTTILSLSAGDVTQLHQDRLWFEFAVLQTGVFKDEYAERVEYKNLLRNGPIGSPNNGWPTLDSIVFPPNVPPAPGIEPRVRALIRRLKAHANFTDAIASDLGINTPVASPPDVIKPTVRAVALPGCCSQLTYPKRDFDGVLAQSLRGNGDWETIGVKIRASFTDDRPPATPGQPEIRQYRLRYMDGDTPVGEWSDVVSVTLAP
jgi:hypothetical protein